jgi:hypothetical protein
MMGRTKGTALAVPLHSALMRALAPEGRFSRSGEAISSHG